ncbi:nucleotidyl transferase AbiEii/AbiGii toxin family protein [Thermodesulfatator autotrophicus]|uniref:nucleotidyl transferase AbiEii/AbiGii toxin family protein n=1 Tax=Thermodesulfatator autotrophicus TaxID=1795632 RepID=UPI0018D3DA01|nr:nucleotidyl transferase AbiEii/AbiGii toxin family protein [Thermodesulfatator autotrophicus]
MENIYKFSQKENIPLFLAGAFALKAYGLSRMTADIDFLTGQAYIARIKLFLEKFGFETLSSSQGFVSFLHPLGGRLDFILVDDDTLKKIALEAQKKEVFPGIMFYVISPRHLTALKIFAVKNQPERLGKEWADIVWMLKHNLVSLEEILEIAKSYGVKEIIKRLDTGL